MLGFNYHPNIALPYLATDFSEYAPTSDLAAADWTKRSAATAANMTTVVTADPTTLSGNKVIVTHTSTINTYGATWNRIPNTTATCDVLALITWGSAGPNGGSGLIARSDTNTQNAYNCVQHGTNSVVHGVFEQAKFTAGSYSSLNQGTTVPVAGSKYWIRFQCNTSIVRGKIWLLNTPEPATWESSSVDTSYTTGYIGLLVVDTSPGWIIEWFAAGLGGYTAPGPAG